jgi:hypothetical protein
MVIYTENFAPFTVTNLGDWSRRPWKALARSWGAAERICARRRTGRPVRTPVSPWLSREDPWPFSPLQGDFRLDIFASVAGIRLGTSGPDDACRARREKRNGCGPAPRPLRGRERDWQAGELSQTVVELTHGLADNLNFRDARNQRRKRHGRSLASGIEARRVSKRRGSRLAAARNSKIFESAGRVAPPSSTSPVVVRKKWRN